MAVLTEVSLRVKRLINLGNFENVTIEVAVTVSRDSDSDTSETLREQALEEANGLLNQAYAENVPRRKSSNVTTSITRGNYNDR